MRAHVDRRLIPGETHEAVHRELQRLATDAVGGHRAISAEVIPIHHRFEPAEVPTESPFIDVVGRAVHEVTGRAGQDHGDALWQRRPQSGQRRKDGGDHVRGRRRLALPLPGRTPATRGSAPGNAGDDARLSSPTRDRLTPEEGMSNRIGVDVGGTFTDLIAYDDATGRVMLAKSDLHRRRSRGLCDRVRLRRRPGRVHRAVRVLPARDDRRTQRAPYPIGRSARAARHLGLSGRAGDPPRQPGGDAQPVVAPAVAPRPEGAAHPDPGADSRRRLDSASPSPRKMSRPRWMCSRRRAWRRWRSPSSTATAIRRTRSPPPRRCVPTVSRAPSRSRTRSRGSTGSSSEPRRP